MRRSCRSRASTATAVLVVTGLSGLAISALASHAQAQAPPPPPPPAASTARTRALSDVLALMNRALESGSAPGAAAGPVLVADSTVSSLPATLPSGSTTSDTVEAQLTALVKTLPAGTIWGKLYLPMPPNRKNYDANALADFALAQTRLFGPIGGSTPSGTIELLGQKLTGDKAQASLTALGLRPYYLISNPIAKSNSGFGLNANPGQWQGMTPDQRKQYIDSQAQSLLSMDPATRNSLMQQNFMIFSSFMRQLPPDQQKDVFSGMMGPGSNVQIRFQAKPGDPQQTPQ